MKNTKTAKEKLRERAIEADLLVELFELMEREEHWYMDSETNEDGLIGWQEPVDEIKKIKLEIFREIRRKVEKVFEL